MQDKDKEMEEDAAKDNRAKVKAGRAQSLLLWALATSLDQDSHHWC